MQKTKECDVDHFIEWNPEKTYYVKCEDEFANRPNPDQCSIIVKPFKQIKDEDNKDN